MVKYLSLSLFFVATLTLAISPHSSLSAVKKDVEFGVAREWQTTITFEVFDKEFIFTNSAEDYHRSFQRLIANYRVNISEKKISEILEQLSQGEKAFVVKTVSSLVLEARKFSVYKHNYFYQALRKTTSEITRLNIVAALEVALVDEYNKVAAVPSLYNFGQSADFRFLYLINHARYEILNASLHRSSER